MGDPWLFWLIWTLGYCKIPKLSEEMRLDKFKITIVRVLPGLKWLIRGYLQWSFPQWVFRDIWRRWFVDGITELPSCYFVLNVGSLLNSPICSTMVSRIRVSKTGSILDIGEYSLIFYQWKLLFRDARFFGAALGNLPWWHYPRLLISVICFILGV